MKNKLSLIAFIIICAVMAQHRISHISPATPLKVTTWDAFGYYMYLPAVLIYHDYKELKWLPEIDKKYEVTGGNGIQAIKLDNGNYTYKYLGGIAVLQLPIFLIGHFIAHQTGYPPDGFSPPYQYAISFGALLYAFLALLLLRRILLYYFSDATVAITLLLLCLATNVLQYLTVDNGQSHAYIFPLYVLVLFTTLQWHRQPRLLWASLTGWIIGMATICRPTEAIMLFIPLFWATHTKEAASEKWALVKQHKSHILAAMLFGVIGILPQLIYWKLSTGSFIYDVGSKWDFLNPHFRVLFGWEKGWFIYTPITVFFIVGMFFIRRFPFRKSVLWFCLLNIWIIIAWHEWRYAASYSTRALVQSYPVFALPLAAFIEKINFKKWRYVFYALGIYLIALNIFQVRQYWTNVLHYDDMNRAYYGRIYWNARPSPLDMSLLDNNDMLADETGYTTSIVGTLKAVPVAFPSGSRDLLQQEITSPGDEAWLKVQAEIIAPNNLWQSYLNADLQSGDSIKKARVRLFRPLSNPERANTYECYLSVPKLFKKSEVKVSLSSAYDFSGVVNTLVVTQLQKAK